MTDIQQIRMELKKLVEKSYLIEINNDGINTTVISDGLNRRIPIIPVPVSNSSSNSIQGIN